ncbi:hypothetical protein BDR03DRAFT_943401 [Suillus americanus]|nr:hypothetical protein BDR03DRAFT_943401 [Suillus americanus]
MKVGCPSRPLCSLCPHRPTNHDHAVDRLTGTSDPTLEIMSTLASLATGPKDISFVRIHLCTQSVMVYKSKPIHVQ